jgi:hypothetical protein
VKFTDKPADPADDPPEYAAPTAGEILRESVAEYHASAAAAARIVAALDELMVTGDRQAVLDENTLAEWLNGEWPALFCDGFQYTLARAIVTEYSAPAVTRPPLPIESLRRVVDYALPSERADYERGDFATSPGPDVRPGGHIYHDLHALHHWLAVDQTPGGMVRQPSLADATRTPAAILSTEVEEVAQEMYPDDYAAITDDHPMHPQLVQNVLSEVARRKNAQRIVGDYTRRLR